MNIFAIMELVGLIAALAAVAFFLLGRQRRLRGFAKSFCALVLFAILANCTIAFVEQSFEYNRTLDFIGNYFDMLVPVFWGIFFLSLLAAVATKQTAAIDKQREFTQQLSFAFTAVVVLNVGYGLFFFIRSRITLEDLRDQIGPVMVSVVNLRSESNNAVQEAFAYVISGERLEKTEFEQWAASFPADVDALRAVADWDQPEELAIFETVKSSQRLLVDKSEMMFVEYESNRDVSLETFHACEAAVDEFGGHLAQLQQFAQTRFDKSGMAISRRLAEGSFEIPFLGAVSAILSLGLLGLLIWNFRRYSSDQELAREDLENSEERHRAFLNSLTDLIWVAGSNKLCTYFNKTWLEFTGRSMQEACRDGWAEGIHQDDFERCQETYAKAFARHESFEMEYRRRRHDGHYRWVLEVGTPRFDVDGTFAGFIGGCIDITERKRVQDSLRQRDQAIRTSVTPIAFGDLEGRITDANQAFADLFGFETMDQVIGRLNTEFPSEPISVEEINSVVEEIGEWSGEVETRRIDGTPITIQLTSTRFNDWQGRPVGSMVAMTDVTARRNADRALRVSEQRYRTLVEEAPEAIVVLDVQARRFADVNENAVKMFGMQREHLLEIGPIELSPENQPDGKNSAATAMEFVQQALDGETPSFEWVHRDSTGKEIPCEIRLVRLPSNRLLVRGAITDISARIRLENALARRALEAELVHQAVTMATETDSLDDALQKCVDIVCEMTGWPLGHVWTATSPGTRELEPTNIWYVADEQRFSAFRKATEETRLAIGEGFVGKIWESGEPEWIANIQQDADFGGSRNCGNLGVMAGFGFPVAVGGKTAAVVELFTEGQVERNETLLLLVRSVGEQVGRVIERKAAEEATRRQHELVAEQLEDAKAELTLKARLAAIGQMSAQMAHEMRNPLGAVSNAVFYLKRHVPESEEKWSEYLDLINREIGTCNRFIGDLLDVFRGKTPTRALADLTQIIEQALSRIEVPNHVEVDIDCQPDPFEVYVDEGQIVQVIDNLLNNAIDAVDDNGGAIQIRAQRNSRYDTISIADTGSGVLPEHRNSLFEVLFTTKATGTGLGLPICRQIIESHDGTIELVGGTSIGTRFDIRLPHASHSRS